MAAAGLPIAFPAGYVLCSGLIREIISFNVWILYRRSINYLRAQLGAKFNCGRSYIAVFLWPE